VFYYGAAFAAAGSIALLVFIPARQSDDGPSPG
jgi:hypothetical protein